MALLGLLLFGVSNSAGDLNPLSALLNLVLLQAWVPSWEVIFSNNAVSWSLSCEAFFYLMTPFVLNRLDGMRYRVKAALLGGWFLLMATVSYILAAQSNFMDVVVYANPLLRSGEFALGLALGLFALKVRDGYRVPVIHGYHCFGHDCYSSRRHVRQLEVLPATDGSWPATGTGLGGIDSCIGALGYPTFRSASRKERVLEDWGRCW